MINLKNASLVRIWLIAFFSISSIACAKSSSSLVLRLPSDSLQQTVYAGLSPILPDSAQLPLQALNQNALTGAISNPEQDAQLLYSFEKNPDFYAFTSSGRYALELEFEPLPGVTSGAGSSAAMSDQVSGTRAAHSAAAFAGAQKNTAAPYAAFAAGFLYEENFTASGAVKTNTAPVYPLKGRIPVQQRFTVSLGFTGTKGQSAQVYGFMVYAGTPLQLIRVEVVSVQYGWMKTGTSWWYGVSADGGTLSPVITGGEAASSASVYTELLRPSYLARLAPLYSTRAKNAAIYSERDQLVLHFDPNQALNRTVNQLSPASQTQAPVRQPQLLFQCGSQQVSAYMAPHHTQLTLDGSLFSDTSFSVEQLDTEPGLIGVTARCIPLQLLSPIPADAGLISDWPQEKWRQPSYELFSWESFPSVLIFDFADYDVQDAFLKRLAFFAEKKGFTGRLVSDAEIHDLHGFNAHDYRAETLAAFFQKVAQEDFPLNASEQHLQTILLHNGIICRTEQGIEAGEGAIVSISRQSPSYLRYRLLTHECLHGIYFTQESFRSMVADVFERTDPRSRLFLRRYFEVDPSLSYNTADSYLLQNEFMAYLLQQGTSYLQEYYLTRLIYHRAIRKAEPELCAYIKTTKAAAFQQAAEQMSFFLSAYWGIKGGRIHLAELKRF